MEKWESSSFMVLAYVTVKINCVLERESGEMVD
jgi:hypothetical protein